MVNIISLFVFALSLDEMKFEIGYECSRAFFLYVDYLMDT